MEEKLKVVNEKLAEFMKNYKGEIPEDMTQYPPVIKRYNPEPCRDEPIASFHIGYNDVNYEYHPDTEPKTSFSVTEYGDGRGGFDSSEYRMEIDLKSTDDFCLPDEYYPFFVAFKCILDTYL